MVRDLELAGGICARSELRGFILFIDCRSFDTNADVATSTMEQPPGAECQVRFRSALGGISKAYLCLSPKCDTCFQMRFLPQSGEPESHFGAS